VPALTALLALGAVLMIPPPEIHRGGEIPREIRRIEQRRPAVLLIGNSYLAAAIRTYRLEKILNQRCLSIIRGGSASASWYLILKNVVLQASRKPRVAVIYFRENDLTLPAFRTIGRTRRDVIDPFSLDREPLLEKLAYRPQKGPLLFGAEKIWPLLAARETVRENIESEWRRLVSFPFLGKSGKSPAKVLLRVFQNDLMNQELLTQRQMLEEETSGQGRGMLDFQSRLPGSFLPEIISLARRAGVRLVFARTRCRYHAMGIPETAPLKNYIRELRRYLESAGAQLLDFSGEQRITIDLYRGGDHFHGSAAGFEKIFARRLRQLLGSVLYGLLPK
jgi:hypothetical protein